MADIMEKFWRAPPVTRTIVAAMFVESALVLSGILPFRYVMYYNPWIFKFPPELWRLLTSFVMTGGGISFLFDLYFMWTYGTGIELNSPRFTEPGSFFVFVCFAASSILCTAGLILGARIFTSPLILAFIYIFALDNRGKKVNFLIFPIPVELLPWAMLTWTLVMGGLGAALVEATGIVAAHSYDFLTRLYPTFQGGRNYITTPNAIRLFFSESTSRFTQKSYGTSVRPVSSSSQTQPQPQNRGWTSGFSSSWGGRGAGRRLGGD